MQKHAILNLDNWLNLFRQHEIRFGFFIFYILLLVWPFFSRTPWSIPDQFFYYFGVWTVLIIGLAIQGYLVIRKERRIRRKQRKIKARHTSPAPVSAALNMKINASVQEHTSGASRHD
ncbi:MAG: hypothetical protein H6999_05430 [Hahellaceae bacterium]|nr:hypothetical protein [Hahellaceae bacterium]MCP5169180.1 hypothetical protein [Hahellaceae bacterium]